MSPLHSHFALLRRLRELRGDPRRLGDFALLQGRLLGVRLSARAAAGVSELVSSRGLAPLRSLQGATVLQDTPAGSLGRALADFYASQAIDPICIDDAIDPEVADLAPLARYLVLHDVMHVLLGYDTSLVEEAGVSGFIHGQGYFAASRLIFLVSIVATILVRPHRIGAILRHARRGLTLGKAAPMLLGEPLEDALDEDLAVLRRRLRIEAVSSAEPPATHALSAPMMTSP